MTSREGNLSSPCLSPPSLQQTFLFSRTLSYSQQLGGWEGTPLQRCSHQVLMETAPRGVLGLQGGTPSSGLASCPRKGRGPHGQAHSLPEPELPHRGGGVKWHNLQCLAHSRHLITSTVVFKQVEQTVRTRASHHQGCQQGSGWCEVRRH